MAYETIVAVFDTALHAQAAVDALKAGGFHEDDISVFDNDRLTAGTASVATGLKEAGLWHKMFGGSVYKHEAAVYGQTVADGGNVVSLRVLDSEVAHATAILDLHRPIDVHDRAVTSGIAPLAHVEAAVSTIAAVPLAAMQTVAVTPKIAELHDEVLRLAEEQLSVGKEMVETGRTRVRRFTSVREVSADVTLHEEHAEVLRRAISVPVEFADLDWSDREIEVTETAEHALATKTARIVEEIGLKKVGSDHVETIHDKLRRQEAEIVQVDAAGKTIVTPRAAV
jgi:stress response protein YsnF